ncbi:hypothetical protein SAMN05216328_11793 [Ensifer sp. YR511]|nr:hypothetical protein SAMN05216328_11793 [Ensifer sp. YR511]
MILPKSEGPEIVFHPCYQGNMFNPKPNISGGIEEILHGECIDRTVSVSVAVGFQVAK